MKDLDFLSIVKKVVKDYKEDEQIEIKFTDTGSYALNALVSGSIYGGIPSNRITAIAGEEATGKSFLVMSIAKSFLEKNSNGNVIYFDTERAIDSKFFEERNINPNSIYIIRPDTVQNLKTQILQILDGYGNQKTKNPLMMILDSLGNLTTSKELEDSTEGKEVLDMTRARQIKSMFRTITEPLGKYSVPFIVTNHTYEVIGAWMPTKTMGGGSGLKYAASTIVYLSKSKDRDSKDKKVVNGIIVKAVNEKSRFTKPFRTVELKIDFSKGLDQIHGLFDVAVKHNIFKKLPSGSYEHEDFPERKLSAQDFIREPEKFYTENILKRIDEACLIEFKLGSKNDEEIELDENQDENQE